MKFKVDKGKMLLNKEKLRILSSLGYKKWFFQILGLFLKIKQNFKTFAFQGCFAKEICDYCIIFYGLLFSRL